MRHLRPPQATQQARLISFSPPLRQNIQTALKPFRQQQPHRQQIANRILHNNKVQYICPIVYADNSDKLNDVTANYIESVPCDNIVILGKEAAVSYEAEEAIKSRVNGKYADKGEYIYNVTRLGGADRYETMSAINLAYSKLFRSGNICLATGENYPDALTGAVFAASHQAPIVLVKPGVKKEDAIRTYIDSFGAKTFYVLGGPAAVADDDVNALVF